MKKIIQVVIAVYLLSIPLIVSGQTAPNIKITMLDGKKTTLNQLLETGPILIDFWATWCVPCKKEMKYLDQFHREYAKDGFQVLTINQDTPRSLSKVKSYIRSKKYKFLVAVDPNQQIANKLNAVVLPTTIMVDQKGKITWRHQGYLPGDEKEIEKQIIAVLNQTTTARDK
ncbi:MAG: TlpA family protein disulfide reductase [Candidatus Marinimicrobia bacterium]|nr:TlpA family protein disulfide reductase [Candidatus Neomarinimicrobiota bacterium]